MLGWDRDGCFFFPSYIRCVGRLVFWMDRCVERGRHPSLVVHHGLDWFPSHLVRLCSCPTAFHDVGSIQVLVVPSMPSNLGWFVPVFLRCRHPSLLPMGGQEGCLLVSIDPPPLFDRPDGFHPLPSIPSHTSHRTARVAATPNQPPHHTPTTPTTTQAHTNTHTHTHAETRRRNGDGRCQGDAMPRSSRGADAMEGGRTHERRTGQTIHGHVLETPKDAALRRGIEETKQRDRRSNGWIQRRTI